MRNTAFLALGFALLVIQSNLFRFIDRISYSIATPSLLLPLLVFMGVHEYSLARGAALCFILGYLLDAFSGAPVGLFTFISVATFVVSRIAGLRLAAQTLITKIGLAFIFSLLESVIIVALTAIFGNDPQRARSLAMLVPSHALTTAAFAPFVFKLAEKVHLLTIATPVPPDGAGR